MSWRVSTWAGIVPRSIGVLLPLLRLPAAVSVLLAGVVAANLRPGVPTRWRRIT